MNVKFVELDNEIVLNDGFDTVQRSFDMDADIIGSPTYEALQMLFGTKSDIALRQRTMLESN